MRTIRIINSLQLIDKFGYVTIISNIIEIKRSISRLIMLQRRNYV